MEKDQIYCYQIALSMPVIIEKKRIKAKRVGGQPEFPRTVKRDLRSRRLKALLRSTKER